MIAGRAASQTRITTANYTDRRRATCMPDVPQLDDLHPTNIYSTGELNVNCL